MSQTLSILTALGGITSPFVLIILTILLTKQSKLEDKYDKIVEDWHKYQLDLLEKFVRIEAEFKKVLKERYEAELKLREQIYDKKR